MKKISKLITVLLAICLMILPLSGCEFFFSSETISFSKDKIDMVFEQTVDLSPYITVSDPDTCVYTLTAQPESGVVSVVSHSVIKAVGVGDAVVTATLSSGNSDTISIKVNYSDNVELSLFESGSLYQKIANTSKVSFSAVFSEGTDPSVGLNWFVDGTKQQATGSQFTLPAQSAAGEYVVRAEHKDNSSVFAEKSVRVYNTYVTPTYIYDGQDMYDSTQKVTFSFDAPITEGNPEYLFEMYVDGVLEESVHSYNPVFEYQPKSAGIYDFVFKVNGEQITDTEGNEHTNICFRGVVTPHGLSLDFDTDFPSVWLRWDNREDTVFTIDLGNNQLILNVAAKNGQIDISDHIEITKSCTIKVKSEDYGLYFLGSDYVSFPHIGIKTDAISYLAKSYLGGNYYMSSDQEVFDIFDYVMVFRPDATLKNGKLTSECKLYMGYTSNFSAAVFESHFNYRLSITGTYSWSISDGNTSAGSIITLSLSFYSENEPTNTSTQGKSAYSVLLAPQLGTGYSKPLPVDSFKLTPHKVKNTNELYYTLQKQHKPDVEKNSAAERIYNQAKKVLTEILDDDMTDEQILRAIYDWIIFSTSYDHKLIAYQAAAFGNDNNAAINYAVLQPAYYPEGVFETGFAVCDGISKSFSLLSNMMGIKCERVIGTAGEKRENHAWNKVLLNDGWYMVDATWGGGGLIIDNRTYKTGTHEFFLLTDAEVAHSHFESGNWYPKSSQVSYNWYMKNDLYVYDNIDLATQMDTFAARVAADCKNGKTFVVQGQTYSADFNVFEIKIAASVLSDFTTLDKHPLDTALGNNGIGYSEYSYNFINENTLVLIIK